MKTLIAAAILSLASFASCAQNSSWTLAEVTNSNKEPVGYIYHTYARGTSSLNSSKQVVVAGLRFICSVKGSNPPIVALFWDGVLMSDTHQNIEITVDKIALLKPVWTRDDRIIYAPIAEHPDLLSAMKRGRAVTFSWEANNSKYKVAFELKDFNLTEFNTSCKTRL